jgi:hypothetical protein
MRTPSSLPLVLTVLCLAGSAAGARGQYVEDPAAFRMWEHTPPSAAGPVPEGAGRAGGPPRLPLFRIAPGVLTDPIGLQDSDDNLPGVPSTPALPPAADAGPDWLQVNMGPDNPYFDFRQPGDPGGLGFYRVNTLVQLLDSPGTTCTLALQAVTPAGLQFAGVADGPTVVSPAFGVFHDLGGGTALQGFVGKNVALGGCAAHPLRRNLQYGMALQRPVAADGPEALRNLFFSVGALGQMHPDRETLKMVPTWDMLPGLHWHVSDNWWVNGGVLVPVGPAHAAPGQWQLTCSFQF